MDGFSELRRKGSKALILLQRRVNRTALLRYGVAGSVEHDAVLKAEPLELVVDVGANRGQFSLAVRHFQPNARILAFEPLESAAKVYRKVFGNDPLAQLHQSAIACSEGRASINLSGREDSSSLLPIGDMMPKLFPGTQSVGVENVSIAPLTRFLAKDDLKGQCLLKIDVQGYELEVLKSAVPILQDFKRIYVEASFVPLYTGQPLADQTISFLQEYSFRLAGFMNPTYHPATGLTVQADLLFERE